ncbi:MAG TPA: DUF1801 domain-containing protein [Acidimicrobiia bacterium]
MVSSKAATVDEYLAELPEERREAIATVRRFILDHLPEGYVEGMNWGMIVYEIPLERYPDMYNKQPIGLVALASQKNYMSLYVWGPDAWAEDGEFRRRWKETGKKLDMGKSCVRFRKVDDLAFDVIGDAIAATSVEDLIAAHEEVHPPKRMR